MSKKKSKRRVVVAEEFAGVDLGDPRREARAMAIADRLAAAPEASLPDAMGDEAMLEAFYRHIRNEDVSFDTLLKQHLGRSGARVASTPGDVYAVHDTTICTFEGEKLREGLGLVNGINQGFLAHATLAVSADGKRVPLGLLGCELWTRKGEKPAIETESARWGRGIDQASKRAGDAKKLIHLADREADMYDLLVALVEEGRRFIIRAKQDRVVEVEGEGIKRLFDAAQERPQTYVTEVPLSRRGGKRNGAEREVHPDRSARMATLTVAALQLSLRRPRESKATLPKFLTVNVVHVFEVGKPAGEEPVEWLLFTSEPIETREQIARVIDGYRARWTIEEYFKALKTGCAFETRQLESFKTLTNLLAYSLVIAYALLLMRAMARSDISIPADALVSSDQLLCLKLMTKRQRLATARDVLDAIAKLGVHLKSNGDPGWRVLSRGWKRLLDFEQAYQALKKAGLVINR